MTLEERAEQIAREIESKHPQSVSVDPMTIMLILTILVEVVKLFMKCHSAAGAVALLANPGWYHRIRMRSVIKRNTKHTSLQTHNDEIEAGIINNGQSVSTQEMTGYYAEVGE